MKLTEAKSKGKSVVDLDIKYDGTGNFDCMGSRLTSLVGAPSSVGGSFLVSNNMLTSLQKAPSSVGGHFYCDNNQLTSLVGAPSSVGGDFCADSNQLISLENVHKQIKQINGWLQVEHNPVKSHVLGVLLIKGITKITLDNEQVTEILNNHLPSSGMRDVLEAQEELMNAGLDEFAQL